MSDGREVLNAWQILVRELTCNTLECRATEYVTQGITMNVVIGGSFFTSEGQALRTAGPAGALLAFAIVAAVAICVMECFSELVQTFPSPCAITDYVRIFVDEDLARVIGFGYWYVIALGSNIYRRKLANAYTRYNYASVFARQIIFAATFLSYWKLQGWIIVLLIYVIASFALFMLNLASVSVWS